MVETLTTKKSTNIRLDWIDYAKGLGIILVVFGHVLKGLNSSNLLNPDFYYYTINFIYSFHMPLFFMLSGYFFLTSFNKRGTKSFLLNKLETIAYPFLIWVTIQTFVEIKLSGLTNGHKDGNSFFEFLYNPKDQFWFIFALFFINIISLTLFNISKKWGIALSVILWVLYSVFKFKTGIFDKTLANLIFFTVGIILSGNHPITTYILKNKILLLINSICFCFFIYVYFNYSKSLWINQLCPQLFGCFIMIHIARLFSEISWLKFLQILGINSMIIYLVHILAASGMRIILSKGLHITNSSIHIIFGTLIGLIIPLIFYHFVKKTKYLLWLFEFPVKNKYAVKPVTALN